MRAIKGVDISSPLEKVMQILNKLRDLMDPSETKLLEEVNYCVKMIGQNKLDEAEI